MLVVAFVMLGAALTAVPLLLSHYQHQPQRAPPEHETLVISKNVGSVERTAETVKISEVRTVRSTTVETRTVTATATATETVTETVTATLVASVKCNCTCTNATYTRYVQVLKTVYRTVTVPAECTLTKTVTVTATAYLSASSSSTSRTSTSSTICVSGKRVEAGSVRCISGYAVVPYTTYTTYTVNILGNVYTESSSILTASTVKCPATLRGAFTLYGCVEVAK